MFSAAAFQQVLFIGFAAVGMYALWNGLVRERYAQTAGQVAISVLIYALALGIIAAPAQTIGWAADSTDQAANAILSLAANVARATGRGTGELQTGRGPLLTAQDALFRLAVFQPFEILDFGGLEHCAANAPASASGISVADAVSADGSGCAPYTGASEVTSVPISNEKYASWFLESESARCALQLTQAALLADAGKLTNGNRLLISPGSDQSCKLGPFDGHHDGAPAPTSA